MNKVSKKSLLSIFVLLSLIAFNPIGHAQETSLIIYSGRSEPLLKPVIDLFEKQTGIKVTLKTGESSALGQQIVQEKQNPVADVYVAKEAGSLEYLRQEGAFQPYESDATQHIDSKFKARDGSWVGASGRTRAVIYNKNLVKQEDLPKTLNDLTDPKWKGKMAAANSGNESVVAWVSALRLALGEVATKDFLTKLKNNDIQLISKSHTDVRKAVGRGEYPIGLINHYYYHLQTQEPDEAVRNVGIVYLDQGDGERGELINVSGAAIIKGAPHMDNAKRFIDFILSDRVQKIFAEVNYEFPLKEGVATNPDVLQALGCSGQNAISCIHAMNVNLDELGKELNTTMQLLDQVNWN